MTLYRSKRIRVPTKEGAAAHLQAFHGLEGPVEAIDEKGRHALIAGLWWPVTWLHDPRTS